MQRAKRKMLNEKLKQIRQAKEQEYGPFASNLERIGKSWSALLGLDFDIPAHDVANMYVAAKLIRTVGCNFKQDTYDDAENYLYQAELMHKREHKSFEVLREQMTPPEPETEPDEEDLAMANRKLDNEQ